MGRAALILLLLCGAAGAANVRVRLYSQSAFSGIRVERAGQKPSLLRHAAVLEPGTKITVNGARPLLLDVPALVAAANGRLRITVVFEEDDYVARVMAGENGGFTSLESLKAMAVAIRSYARAKRGRHDRDGFDYCDTTHCQDLRFTVQERLQAAAQETSGEVLWYGGKPAATVYHENCGGRTEAAAYIWPGVSMPYLRSVNDTFCQSGRASRWQAKLTLEELGAALGFDHLADIAVRTRTPTGRVTKLFGAGRVIDAEALHYAVGRKLRWGLIQSRAYDLAVRDGVVYFSGSGAGHGVGLCQTGAMERAAAGHSYRQILAAYYPGATLGLTSAGAMWNRVATERADVWFSGAAKPELGPMIDRAVVEAERRAGKPIAARPAVRVYPSPAHFRDATGEPGWIAASTRGRTVRLKEPFAEQALVHEMLHVALNERTRRAVPLWFAEGLAAALERPQPQDAAQGSELLLVAPKSEAEYRQGCRWASSRVAQLIQRHGRDTVLGWLEKGLPAELR